VALIVALVVTVVTTPIAAWVAVRLDMVDRPGRLKVQERPVPYLGGLAVFAGLAGPVAIERPAFILPLALSLGLGLADDIKGPSPATRLSAEALIGIIVALVLPADDFLRAVVMVLLVVALINAINLLDGLDALASGVCLVSAVGFALVLEAEFRLFALALAGSLAGFLVWNRPPARIYLGNGGSYLVGTALAMLLNATLDERQSIAVASGAVLFVAVPVADAVVAIVRRMRARRPLLYGDRGHVYDQLVDRGRSPIATVGICTAVQAAFVGIGVGIVNFPAALAIVAAMAVLVFGGAALLVAFTVPGKWNAR
jgi:UDP-GlcNAc:undecaprenyl-phosphate/decaprenyl-phosphate GlcNAc-1-phosphate transferase